MKKPIHLSKSTKKINDNVSNALQESPQIDLLQEKNNEQNKEKVNNGQSGIKNNERNNYKTEKELTENKNPNLDLDKLNIQMHNNSYSGESEDQEEELDTKKIQPRATIKNSLAVDHRYNKNSNETNPISDKNKNSKQIIRNINIHKALNNDFCNDHRFNVLHIICVTCNKVICDKCLILNHKTHDTQELGYLNQENLQNWLSGIHSCTSKLVKENLIKFEDKMFKHQDTLKELYETELKKLDYFEKMFSNYTKEIFANIREILNYKYETLDRLRSSTNLKYEAMINKLDECK